VCLVPLDLIFSRLAPGRRIGVDQDCAEARGARSSEVIGGGTLVGVEDVMCEQDAAQVGRESRVGRAVDQAGAMALQIRGARIVDDGQATARRPPACSRRPALASELSPVLCQR
jgi:hypothetical protein